MFTGRKKLIGIGLLTVLMGCASDRPTDYGQRRPDVDSLHPDDGGLQSKDLLTATDAATADLLALPALNDSRTQWTIVASEVFENQTSRRTPFNIFIDRLKTQVARQGHGRVQIIENKARFHGIQGNELEGGAPGPDSAPFPAGIQPQFALYGKVAEMPNRATSTFRFEFNLTDLRNRTIVWTNEYIVKVER